MTSFIPKRLQTGDVIAVIAPASPTEGRARIAKGVSYLLSRGFRVRLGNSVGLVHGYLSGNDRLRTQDIEEMFADEQVRAVLCTRGGYGAARLLDSLNWEVVRSNPKIFVGFSDITALSMALFSKSSLITFAGPMVAVEFAGSIAASTETAFWDMIMQPEQQRKLDLGPTVRTIRAGNAEGPLLGGNLAVFCSLIGTPYMPGCKGAVLFFEDNGEPVYRIDRMLLQLRQSGILADAAGILFGSFTAIPMKTNDRQLDEVFEEYVLPLNIPALAGLQFGHIREKITLPFGAWVAIQAGKGVVTVSHPVVR